MDIKTLLEDEIDILYTTLDRLKIYDIRLSHTKDGRIFAKDADSQWTGKNFYKFLLNDAIVYNQDGTSSVLTEPYPDIPPAVGKALRCCFSIYGIGGKSYKICRNEHGTEL